jgi:HlyD family secretion protein
MRKLLILGVLALLAFCYWFFVYNKQTLESEKIYGNVDIHQVSLAFETSGRINAINYREGAKVTTGQVLATLDTKELELELAAKETALNQAQENLRKLKAGNRTQEIATSLAKLDEAKAQEKLAKLTFKRKNEVYVKTKGTGISLAEVDEARASLEVAQATVHSADEQYKLMKEGSRAEDIRLGEIAVQAAKDNINLIKHELSKAVLVAPQPGVIRTRLLEVGDMASSQSAVFALLLNTQKWVRAYVDYNSLPNVKIGKEATISFGERGQLKGTIGYISSVAEFTPKNVETEELRTNLVYEIRIDVEDPEDLLRMGMPVTVEIGQ